MKYYTLQIIYTTGLKKNVTEELTDLTTNANTPEGHLIWMRLVREKLFTTGFQIQTSPTTVEFIHPARITGAYLILQDGKILTT